MVLEFLAWLKSVLSPLRSLSCSGPLHEFSPGFSELSRDLLICNCYTRALVKDCKFNSMMEVLSAVSFIFVSLRALVRYFVFLFG